MAGQVVQATPVTDRYKKRAGASAKLRTLSLFSQTLRSTSSLHLPIHL